MTLPGRSLANPSFPRLRADAVTVQRQNRPVVDSLSLELAQPELCALVGPNGSGKSSFIRCLAGIYRPDSGAVTLDGENLRHIPARHLHRQIAYVPQDNPMTFDFTVGELVGLGNGDPERVRAALRLVELEAMEHRSLLTLSGGERQRAALARAFAQDTPLILLDEPAAHLDPHHQYGLMASLHRMVTQEGRAILTILHDLSLAAAYADRVFLLNKGKFVAEGPPADVLSVAHIEKVYQIRLRVETDPLTQRPHFLPPTL